MSEVYKEKRRNFSKLFYEKIILITTLAASLCEDQIPKNRIYIFSVNILNLISELISNFSHITEDLIDFSNMAKNLIDFSNMTKNLVKINLRKGKSFSD